MTDQTNLPPNSLQSRPTWSDLSSPLKGWLLGARGSLSPALLDEAERAWPAIREEATRSSRREEIITILAKRFALFPQPDRSEAEWDAWWDDYVSALGDQPPSAIEAGMAAYVRDHDSEFFPKPGRLRELAKTVPNPMAMACEALRRDIERRQRVQGPAHDPAPERGPAVTKDEVQAMMADFRKVMAERAPPPKPMRPPVSGPVDERGITAAMRAHLAGEQS